MMMDIMMMTKKKNLTISKKGTPPVNFYRFSPYAFQKVIYMRDKGGTEVSGFCITDSHAKDLVVDFQLVKQTCTSVTTDMDKDGLSDFIETMADQDISPGECMRVWLHTHPGSSPSPSGTDEKTFEGLMEKYPYIVMLIIAKGGAQFGRIGFTQGCGGYADVDWEVDWTIPGEAVDFDEWDAEYEAFVHEEAARVYSSPSPKTAYQSNFEFIDWSKRSLRDEIEEDYFRDDPQPIDQFDFDALEDDEIRQLVDEVKEKSIHEMTEAQYAFFQKYQQDLNLGDDDE